ncbi:uncharacterized protein LOC123266982 isoform X1 [Cotesia glomerata]|uniref:uncharacterized protein LOC123266982 isoform X1 n=1 Tax=Cotesia glomerata TaxID=32391 RepID=UPI001D01C09D|nr:uncharacterized protein LOC123266982 isoform X1 [Cotesia glomerata]
MKFLKVFGVKYASVVNLFLVFVFVIVLGQVYHANGESEKVGICAMAGCNCTIVAKHWVNVKCIFTDYEEVELHEGSIPADASDVSVSRCRELRIHSGAFTGGPQLKRVHVTGIHSVVAKTQAFHNISAPNPLLEVTECNRVVLESQAFKNARGTLSVSISRCKHVEIKPNAFSWLLRFSISQVPDLELSSNAFKFDAPPHGRHGPATKIMFQSVKITELPSSVFPSAAAEIRMDDVWTKVIRKDAFCALLFLGVRISNASINDIEYGAFNDKTLIHNFELIDVSLRNIKNGSFRAAFNNFTIQYSRVDSIESGAIDISAAAIAFNNNEFHLLEKKSITLKQWSKIIVDHNHFIDIAEDGIVADEIAEKTPEQQLEFSFRGNRINKAEKNSLRFASISEKSNINNATVGNNYFEKMCNCFIENYIREITGRNSSVEWIMKSSYCIAGDWLGNCLKIPQGYLEMGNFTSTICSPEDNVVCREPSEKPTSSVSPPSVGPHVYPRQNSFFDVEMSDSEQLEREKRLIVIVCVAAVFVIIAIILTSGILYMRRRGVCPKLTSGHLMNLTNSWLSPNSGMTAATSARSISRLSINEYAGLRPEMRTLNENEQNDNLQENADVLTEEGFTYTENKASQTLPEELTEEYLRELRDRLNDPDNYSQARDMIEHLYDLIKVEESCNNNNERPGSCGLNDEENTYDIIAPRIRRPRNQKPTTDMGTKVPSLEKLLPSEHSIVNRPAIAEYTEPRDLRTSDQNHLYAELPGDETVPSTSRLSQPILAATLAAARAPLPLPPDVVNDHLINNKSSCKSSNNDSCRNNNNYERQYLDLDVEHPYQEAINDKRHQSKSLFFFKALGDSLKGNKMSNNNNCKGVSLFAEYADPNDVTAHLYSELPEPQGSSTPVSKMANRPLPIKPDQENVTINLART